MSRVFAVAVGCLGISASISAGARSMDVTASWCPGVEIVSSTEVAPQQMIATYKVSGGVKWAPAGGNAEMLNGVCQGHLSVLGGPPSAAGNCLWVDKDGDKIVFSYSRTNPAPGKIDFTMGTGKFAGIRGGGDYTVTPLPAIAGTRNGCPESKLKVMLPD